MDRNEKIKIGGTVGGAALIALIIARCATPTPPTVVRSLRVDRMTGSALEKPRDTSLVFGGDLEMPLGTTCDLAGTGTARTAACTLKDGRHVKCVVDKAGWGCASEGK